MSGGGDTPLPNTFKWRINRQAPVFAYGRLVPKSENTYDAGVCRNNWERNKWGVANETGEVISGGNDPDSQLEQMLLEDIGARYNAQIDQISLIDSPANPGKIIPDWDNYVDCTP